MHHVVLFEIGLHSKIIRFWTCKDGTRRIKVTCYNQSYGNLWICSPRVHLNRYNCLNKIGAYLTGTGSSDRHIEPDHN